MPKTKNKTVATKESDTSANSLGSGEAQFHRLCFRVVGAGSISLDSLPAEERGRLVRSRDEAARRLALKNVRYNRSRGQTGTRAFDAIEFAFRAWKYLPALRQGINEAIDANDLGWFIRFGKVVEKVKRQPPGQVESGDPLGAFLVRNWTHPRLPLCRLSEAVLVEVCRHCKPADLKLTPKSVKAAVNRLVGEERVTRAQNSGQKALEKPLG
jgi:hypothetical protein